MDLSNYILVKSKKIFLVDLRNNYVAMKIMKLDKNICFSILRC